MTATQTSKWAGLGYQQVRGLADRHIARYLRASRKTMTRFFTDRGLVDFTERMVQIRKSRQGMMAKNQMFQEVLDDYANVVVAEANDTQAEGKPDVGVQAPAPSGPVPAGTGTDTGSGVPPVESGASSGMLIEE